MCFWYLQCQYITYVRVMLYIAFNTWTDYVHRNMHVHCSHNLHYRVQWDLGWRLLFTNVHNNKGNKGNKRRSSMEGFQLIVADCIRVGILFWDIWVIPGLWETIQDFAMYGTRKNRHIQAQFKRIWVHKHLLLPQMRIHKKKLISTVLISICQ